VAWTEEFQLAYLLKEKDKQPGKGLEPDVYEMINGLPWVR
jgi:hypothetical protein